jgi:TfoX/Sxy family transcriptional regulator of competence genes
MAYNDKLTVRVREALAHLSNVEEKTMFRGVTFMVNDKMCISSGDDELMLRIDPAQHEHVVEQDGCRSIMMKGKVCKGYVYVHEDSLKSKKVFDYWIGLALDFNKHAKAAKKRKTAKKP